MGDLIYKRHSVRKFKNTDVPLEDIKKIIKDATYAPSGKNLQNWHFIVVKNKKKIQEMSKIVEKKNEEMASKLMDEEKKKSLTKYVKYHTVFKDAPVAILVYAGKYPSTGVDVLKEINASDEEIKELEKVSPGIQNISAAMENLLLSAADLGYGTCWMTGPLYAAKEINEFLGFEKEGYFLAAITPLGVSDDSELKSPPRKPVDEVLTIIE
ncbi:MAG: nitroreductase family protein [Firmicutes bacterium]|nr:nitroreductase family protein [Bacillota bacterium]